LSRRAGDIARAACVTVLGSGYLRPAPATWGSVVAVLIFAGLWWAGAGLLRNRAVVEIVVAVGVLAASALSVRWGPWAIERFGGSDPRNFVLDEFAGQWLALLALPVACTASASAVAYVLAGQFLLFRVFDIVKPPPAYDLQKLPAGWGILLDDLFAGAYANIVGQLVWRLSPLASWLGIVLGSR